LTPTCRCLLVYDVVRQPILGSRHAVASAAVSRSAFGAEPFNAARAGFGKQTGGSSPGTGGDVSTSEIEPRDARELEKAISLDQHGIEPIPDADQDSTAWQQFWIWFGANMSPLFWVAGAIGPQLGLSLVQSIVIMVVGQALGALIFGVFTLMGKRTGVSQFALGRAAFGRRGNVFMEAACI
jgi:Permease for cytosine/purines, uracil, thiamine, allantoin